MPQVEGHDALVGCFAQCGVEARGRLPAAPLLRGWVRRLKDQSEYWVERVIV